MNEEEKKTVSKMIHIYCAAKHGTSHALCSECDELNKYAQKRLSQCRYGNEKPTCKKCPIHCYARNMKIQIQKVMRYSGPRIIFHSPISAISHLFKEFK